MTNWNSFFEGILDERLIKVNEPMANHNTYGIGGNADVFVSPADKESLIAVLRKAAAFLKTAITDCCVKKSSCGRFAGDIDWRRFQLPD